MRITIFVGSLFREFELDDDDIINKDWSEEVADMLDTIKKADQI